jgi:hypothetical protein
LLEFRRKFRAAVGNHGMAETVVSVKVVEKEADELGSVDVNPAE